MHKSLLSYVSFADQYCRLVGKSRPNNKTDFTVGFIGGPRKLTWVLIVFWKTLAAAKCIFNFRTLKACCEFQYGEFSLKKLRGSRIICMLIVNVCYESW